MHNNMKNTCPGGEITVAFLWHATMLSVWLWFFPPTFGNLKSAIDYSYYLGFSAFPFPGGQRAVLPNARTPLQMQMSLRRALLDILSMCFCLSWEGTERIELRMGKCAVPSSNPSEIPAFGFEQAAILVRCKLVHSWHNETYGLEEKKKQLNLGFKTTISFLRH